MSGQRSILSFLKPIASVKRPLSEGNNANATSEMEPLSKKVKHDVEIEISSTQIKKEWPNEIVAKIKLTSRRCPALHTNIGRSWFRALEPEFKLPYFMKLSQFLQRERAQKKIFPPEDKVWTWTQMCEISDVKVVILGQDPYHSPGQAHGLCFSVPEGIQPPPSLINMYQELETDIPDFVRPSHGCLVGWAEQGVLLLNACLTVVNNSANSHRDQGWEQLTDAVIRTLSARNNGLVFLLWGAYAQKKAAFVDKPILKKQKRQMVSNLDNMEGNNLKYLLLPLQQLVWEQAQFSIEEKKHHLLKAPHPSPLSAHRGFFGCKHFSTCNRLLRDAGKKPIDWSHLPLKSSVCKTKISGQLSKIEETQTT